MGKFKRSWNILKRSLKLLCGYGNLLLFPLISFCAASLLFLLIAGGMMSMLGIQGYGWGAAEYAPLTWRTGLVWFLIYLLAMFVMTFCSAAFFSEIFHALKKENVSILRGFRTAAARVRAIFWWSLAASTVGLVLRIAGGHSVFRQWMLRTLGIVWGIASCFAVPVIMAEPDLVDPFRVLKRSGETINRTWGEALIGFAGFQFVVWGMLAVWGICAAGLWSFAAFHPDFQFAASLMTTAAFFAVLAVAYFVSAAEKVYLSALYLYAEEQVSVPGYEDGDLKEGFAASRPDQTE